MSKMARKKWSSKSYSALGSVLTKELMEIAISEATGDIKIIHAWNVQNWLNYGSIPEQYANLPAAVEAQEIMNSPLYRALNEEEE